MEMDHAITESALVQQLEPEADVVGQGWIAASHNDGGEKQMALVDQTELQCLGSERRTAHRDVARRGRLQMLDRFGLELPSILVLPADTRFRLLEYTILSVACQIFAYSCPADGSSLSVDALSQ